MIAAISVKLLAQSEILLIGKEVAGYVSFVASQAYHDRRTRALANLRKRKRVSVRVLFLLYITHVESFCHVKGQDLHVCLGECFSEADTLTP